MIHKKPVRVLQAQFENFTLKTLGRSTCIKYSDALSEFFRLFPKQKNPEDFFRTDVEDYKLLRQREDAHPTTINFELSVLRAFWSWMIEYKALPLSNIATVTPFSGFKPKRETVNRLNLSDFSRLVAELHDPRLCKALRLVLENDGQVSKTKIREEVGVTTSTLNAYLQAACQRAGIQKQALSKIGNRLHKAALAKLASDLPMPI
jgi:hypothetical protein